MLLLCVCVMRLTPTRGKSSLVALPILHIMSLAFSPYSEQVQEIWLHVLSNGPLGSGKSKLESPLVVWFGLWVGGF